MKKENWLQTIIGFVDKATNFFNSLTDVEKLLSGLKSGLKAFGEELKKKDDKK